MTLQEHEFSDAERKRREDEIWNAAIEAAACELDGWHDIYGDNAASAIRSLKCPVS